MVELDDKELMELYRAGKVEQMFNQLVRQFHTRVYWVARRMVRTHEDADDIAQEVFVRAYNAFANFRGESNIYTWLYRITVNLSINHLRRQKIRRFIDITNYSSFFAGDDDQARDLVRGESLTLIEKAIDTLPEKQRAVFIMRYYDEIPYEQISAILGTSVGGLKANFHHAVKKVVKYVRKYHKDVNIDDLVVRERIKDEYKESDLSETD